ncbi:MAG: sugar phosphate nucleotidyltransferase, partial [Planctomycetota bacterium]
MKHLHALIMAGGSGTRFWPRSRRKVPKQFLSLVGDLPLLAATVKRVSGICPPERTWILTRRDLLQDVQRILPQHPASRIITEPEGRDTAPCLVYGSARVERVDPEARLLVLPSDHVIPETELFLEAVAGALDSLRVVDGLLTFGVLPTYPSTGFGYILREAGSGIPA